MRPSIRPLGGLALIAMLMAPAGASPAAEAPPSPLTWEPTVSQLVALVRGRLTPLPPKDPPTANRWSPSDVSVTYSFRADTDAESARSRTDAFDELLATEGVDLRWSEGQSAAQVHYLTLKLDWDFDGRVEEEAKQRAESRLSESRAREAEATAARKAIELFAERRSLQAELLAKELPTELVWAKSVRVAAINAELDLVTAGAWQRLLREGRPEGAPAWLSGLDAD